MATWLSENRKAVGLNNEWLSTKLREIPAWLKKLEHTEFNRTFLDTDFDGVNDFDFHGIAVFQDHQTQVNGINAVGRYYSEAQLPVSMRLAHPTGTSNGGGDRRRELQAEFATNPRVERRPRREDRSPGPRNDRAPPASDDKHNPDFHPKFKAFWDGVDSRHREAKLSDLCYAAGQANNESMNVTKLTVAMGLNPNNCGTYYVRGRCKTGGCTKDHSVFNFARGRIDAAVATLKRGCDNYRGPRNARGRS